MLIRSYTDRSWGLVHTKSRCENLVGTYLTHSGLPIYVPCIYKTRTKYRVSKLPMFSCYLFAAWNRDERSILENCSGIADFHETPAQCDDEIVQQLALLAQLEELSKSQTVTLQKTPTLESNTGDSLSGLPGAWRNIGGERILAVSLTVMGAPLNATIKKNPVLQS